MQGMELMMICRGMTMKRREMLGVSVRKMKALNVKMETVQLSGKGRQILTCFVYVVYETVKHFFLLDVLFLGCHLRFGYIHFPLGDMFYLGGHLRLESSYIWVNTVYFLLRSAILFPAADHLSHPLPSYCNTDGKKGKITTWKKKNTQNVFLTSYSESTEWAMKYANMHTTKVGTA